MGSTKKGTNTAGFKTAPRSKIGVRPSSFEVPAEDLGLLRNGDNSVDPNNFYGNTGSLDLPCSTNNTLSPSTSGRFAGPSVSMDSGSMESPSRCSDVAMFTPGSNGTSGRFPQIDPYDEPASPDMVGRKKKRGHRSTLGGEKGGKGLRHFSMKVCEKVESKGRTTYNEVADELVAEFTNPNGLVVSPDQQQYDEKNIRRRVYDALNVLMAMDIISKEKKEIQWKGLPSTSFTDAEQLKEEQMRVRSRIEKKKKYLQELQEQIIGIQNLIHRNERLYNGTGSFPAGGVALPFILVQTRPQATVEVEISEDMQVVHFDFNSSSFELHDDASILKAMKFCEQSSKAMTKDGLNDNGFDSPLEAGSPLPNMFHHGRSPRMKNGISPPLPGILKARVKHEHLT